MSNKIGLRLAMRVEGNFWIAYIAKGDTMNDAVLLGSIAMAAVVPNSQRRREFLDLMKDAMAELLKDQLEQPDGEIEWDETPAPEHERAGNA